MRYLSKMTSSSHLSLFFSIILLFRSLPTLANPIDSRSLAFTPNYRIPQAAGAEVLQHPNPDTGLTTLHKRAFVSDITLPNPLNQWKMVLTASAFLLNSDQDMIKFFTNLATRAAVRATAGAAEMNEYAFYIGELTLTFKMRNDIQTNGRGPLTIPWSVVSELAAIFRYRAVNGFLATFDGHMWGPLPENQYGAPW